MTDEERSVHNPELEEYNAAIDSALSIIAIRPARIRELRDRLQADIDAEPLTRSSWSGIARNDVRREVIEALTAILEAEPK